MRRGRIYRVLGTDWGHRWHTGDNLKQHLRLFSKGPQRRECCWAPRKYPQISPFECLQAIFPPSLGGRVESHF